MEGKLQQPDNSVGQASPTPANPKRSKSFVTLNPSKLAARSAHSSEAGNPTYQVLLVEDNLVNQKVLSKQMHQAGCTVYVANHGLEALGFLQQSNMWKNNVDGKKLDVVLMDLEMPVMDGLTCARRIRQLQREGTVVRHVPLIAVTANARMEQIEVSMAAGMVSRLLSLTSWPGPQIYSGGNARRFWPRLTR